MKHFKELLHIQEASYCVTVTRDTRCKNKNDHGMMVEVWVKTDNSIRYSLQRTALIPDPALKVNEWVAETQLSGLVSPRPYVPGQACDGTITACAISVLAECPARHSALRRIYPALNYMALKDINLAKV